VADTTRFSAATKAELLELVRVTQTRTGWTVRRILKAVGLTKARYRDWVKRAARDALADRPPIACLRDGMLLAEKEAVIQYALRHTRDGYRRLAWQMVDADVAYLSPSSVYRVLKEADLLSRWKRSQSSGTMPAKPSRPHERWHTDLMYLRIQDTWYFLVTVLDAYSRYVVHWELLTTMRAADVQVVLQHALEVTGATPDVVTDNGSQFTAKEFKDLIRRFAFKHIRIRWYHPESNGLVERFHRSTREALGDAELRNLGHARELIGAWVRDYNEQRLHAGLGYLTPAEYYRGDPAARRAEREIKLALGRQRRREINQTQSKEAA